MPPTFKQLVTRVNHSTLAANSRLGHSSFWFNTYAMNVSAGNYTRRELLKNISKQIKNLENDDNEIHRLRNLSRRLETNLQYSFPMRQLQIFPYIVFTIAAVLPTIGIICVALKTRAMSQRLLALEQRMNEHEAYSINPQVL